MGGARARTSRSTLEPARRIAPRAQPGVGRVGEPRCRQALAPGGRRCRGGRRLLRILRRRCRQGLRLEHSPGPRLRRLHASRAAGRFGPDRSLELPAAAGVAGDRAGASAATTLMQNSAQTCTAPTRLLLEAPAHDRFVELLATRIGTIRLGRGLDNPDMGPVVSERQMQRVLGFIAAGLKDGARAVAGGRRADGAGRNRGFFIEPTLLDQVAPGTELGQEEIFGPVLTVTTFGSVDEAIAVANGTPYGLVTGVWTRDLSRARTVATAVKSGQVRVNSYSVEGSIGLPFGGYKRSGFGREQGVEALANYTQVKNVMINFG